MMKDLKEKDDILRATDGGLKVFQHYLGDKVVAGVKFFDERSGKPITRIRSIRTPLPAATSTTARPAGDIFKNQTLMAQQDKGRTRDVDNIVGGYQDKLVINVRTVPNGYTLDIEKGEKKQGFMY